MLTHTYGRAKYRYMSFTRLTGRRAVRDTTDGEIIEPKLADVWNVWAEPDAVVCRPAHLTEDVTQADLRTYADHQLQARAAYYERQITFEKAWHVRQEFRQEFERTQIEINRRKMYARTEANRVFEL